ncbi:alpha/beta fold hydrolase [Companilactobacillus sp.]|uniref:alpha/beta fold hydrolase n=1 Tax=Companilactobacillus sp. TaxID=2767905 RepID=UPI0025C2F935|nr:alpha/beta fold hydrolase [Companilactobacillus sp.]MCH4009014.1 acetylxylan esterase [Companilactobacillus sp.]MCH4050807.1 acetylxylan esterase [Companilactobacillus sp.]MCH4076956.1 acetylxylan esterase [Companilactobacillus sp.]MCH4125532.1 acetylxylan esterase [Companilactobacillus sp.]MCI1311241.1 acetylxylan esterase [Companilactobacillus sp.]
MRDPMPLAEMKNYLGRQEVPSDFDEFWNQQISELPSSFNYTLTPQNFGLTNIDCYELSFQGTNHSTVYAKCLFPKNSTNIPTVFNFHGYMGQSSDWSDLLQYPAVGYGIVAMDVRGQSGKSTDERSVTGNTVKGQIVRGVTSGRDNLFFKDVYLDVYSLIEIIAQQDFVDSDNLAVFGGSQGGALSLVAAALNPRIKKTAVIYPFLSDFKRVLEIGNRDEPYDELFRYFKFSDPLHLTEDKILDTLSYIDVKNMAHRIKSPVKLFTGLEDQVCFPSTQFAMFNRLNCDKKMYPLPEYGHEEMHVHVNDMIFNWLTDSKIQIKTQME